MIEVHNLAGHHFSLNPRSILSTHKIYIDVVADNIDSIWWRKMNFIAKIMDATRSVTWVVIAGEARDIQLHIRGRGQGQLPQLPQEAD